MRLDLQERVEGDAEEPHAHSDIALHRGKHQVVADECEEDCRKHTSLGVLEALKHVVQEWADRLSVDVENKIEEHVYD